MIWSIYLIVNHRNFKVYVGQTKRSVNKRFIGHCSKKKNASSVHFAIKKYGRESFSIEIIDSAFSQTEANIKEEFWIKEFKSSNKKTGYNILDKANGIKEYNKGRKFSEEHKRNISLSMTEDRKKALLALNVKQWVLISPEGEKFEITNLNKFCEEKGLCPANMVKLTTKRKSHYHLGWQCFKKEFFSEDQVLPPRGKINCGELNLPWIDFLMPCGEIKRIENIQSFCRENSLDQSAIYKLIKGKQKSCKGIKVYTPNSSS